LDRFDSMAVLIAAAEAGSLSAASRRLGMPLTTVSRKVAQLEAMLKTQLLNRSSRRLALTETGRNFVAAGKRILEELEAAEREAAGEYSAPKGELVITAPMVFGRMHLLPVIADFLKLHPAIDIRLVQADGRLNLLEDRVDLALRIGALGDSSLIATRLGATRYVVCASPAYLKARGKPRTPRELGAHDCITFAGVAAPESWSFPMGRRHGAVRVHSRLVVNTAEASIDAAIAGLGITRALSYQIADTIGSGRLVTLLETFEPEPWPVHLVYAGGRLVPAKLRAFLDFAAPRLKAVLARAAPARAKAPRRAT
jgi:DNA-binding transcriptional LysR family regulator